MPPRPRSSCLVDAATGRQVGHRPVVGRLPVWQATPVQSPWARQDGRMEFREVVRRRRMVRRFDPDRPVASDVLDEVLYAAQRAPSAGFSQGWDFVVLAEGADRRRFWEASRDPELPE